MFNRSNQFGQGPSRQPGGYGRAPPPPPPPNDSGHGRALILRPSKVADPALSIEYIYGNITAVSPSDFPSTRDGSDLYILVNGKFVVSARPTQTFPSGCIGLTGPQREWAGISMIDTVTAEIYEPFKNGQFCYLGSMDVEIGFAGKKTTDTPYDQDVLSDWFIRSYQNQIFAPGQELVMDYQAVKFSVKVKTVKLVDLSLDKAGSAAEVVSTPTSRGILTKQTVMTFYKDAKSSIKLKGSAKRPATNSIISPDFKFEDMGIGGLDKEFGAIFRRAFTSRLFSPAFIDQLGIQHVRGLLLYGPPGTGKTLIAREIGKMLNSREPKIINGPEILNKFVGQSEENIRKLFADAEKEYKEKGDESELHIIIFDELDAVCKQRGSGAGGGTGVGDSVVNQLLSKLDGVEQLNNILLIGMTNRKDMIDEALLRPGRLEVHMEIPLPDEAGRLQIFKIHTKKLVENKKMDSDVNLTELASLSKNFSGAEILGLVRSATSFALNKHLKIGQTIQIQNNENTRVSHMDFMNALNEVKPAFGVSEDELDDARAGPILEFSSHVKYILEKGATRVNAVRARTAFNSFLLYGPPGAGKTALAAEIAMRSEFPFIKLISPDNMGGLSEAAKIQYIIKVFSDAYKSPVSMVVVDDLERLIDWVDIGPRFSTGVLSTLLTVLNKRPPKGRRLLIIATTSKRTILEPLDLLRPFHREEIGVPNVETHAELANILIQKNAFESQSDVAECLNILRQMTGSDRIGLGIKDIYSTIDNAIHEHGKLDPERFAEGMAEKISTA